MGVNNGKQVLDVCNLCGGLATRCVGCDGQPEPNMSKRAAFDACEMCGGDNSTCSLLLLVFNTGQRAAAGAQALWLAAVAAAVVVVAVQLEATGISGP
mmetsp:Transcript_35316/g.72711  ORF Transcript_35316/g.72711 Transcript_35316/m.72711 type:complete len:98 (-) Transcript_35316:193-486(-)